MISVFKLIGGEEIIGETSYQRDSYTLTNPMYIIDSPEYGMRLRDCLLLSEQNVLTIKRKYIILDYKPTKTLCEYYTITSEYTTKFSRPFIDAQIKASIKAMKIAIKEEEETVNKLSDTLRNITRSSLH